MSAESLFIADGITKRFPGVVALNEVKLSLEAGSIHALLGENGAGKSTLIKAMTGVHPLDSGRMLLDGAEFRPKVTRDATARGIGVVHQERNLIPRFSIAENIFLERLAGGPFQKIVHEQLVADSRQWLDMLEIDADPSLPVERLNVARMQLVEIARALSLGSHLLLLDEPTASLTAHETDALFRILRRLRDAGTGLMFVSHKLEEVQEICDRVTVLRDGENACESRSLEGLGRQDIVRLMIGRSEIIPDWKARDRTDRETVLQLENVSTPLGHRGIDLTVHAGEIVGLYGLVGAGRSELAKSILGKFPITGGTLSIRGKPVKINNVADAVRRYRMGYVSEDRKNEGLVLMHSVLDNVGAPIWRRLAGRLGLLRDGTVRTHALPFIRKLEVRTPSLAQSVGNLSGGNQQKVSVAKWLAAETEILIVDEPSVGIDIKTKAYLHELIRELSDSGIALILITSDMPEMIALADRIVVMNNYRVTGEIDNTRHYDAMSEQIMALIQGEEAALAEG